MRNPLTLRGWIAAILIGMISATLTTLAIVQVRHWMIDEAQLHQIVGLIQSGRIRVVPETPPPQVPPPPPSTPKQ